jgi:hypothetical protein
VLSFIGIEQYYRCFLSFGQILVVICPGQPIFCANPRSGIY